MTAKNCNRCGNNIPRKVPSSSRKTRHDRKTCFDCMPRHTSAFKNKSASSTKTLGDYAPSKKRTHKKSRKKTERQLRKEKLVGLLGGCCSDCGYNKSVKSLSFHHIDPKKKSFDISSNGNMMQEWSIVLKEAQKCMLLCLNCHAELHNGK